MPFAVMQWLIIAYPFKWKRKLYLSVTHVYLDGINAISVYDHEHVKLSTTK